jgi:hypothetical protein
MTKITSIDDLVDRTKVAFPHWVKRSLEVREWMEAEDYSRVYYWLSNGGLHYSYPMFSSESILEILDENDHPIQEKLTKLIMEAREITANEALEPVRRQLAVDFRKTFDFVPIYD